MLQNEAKTNPLAHFPQNFKKEIIKQNVPGGLIFSGFSTMYSRYP